MNLRKKAMSAMLLTMMLCILCISSVVAAENNKGKENATILFTHDLHSHLEEFKTEKGMVGGVARLKTAIDEKRAENPATFVFDGGDFSMGTVYQTIYETHAPELTMLGRLGYDAVTFGNHEFDYRSEGTANMLRSALENAKSDSSVVLPQFVIANIDWQKNQSKENKVVEKALDDYGSTAYTIIEREGIKVGVFGVLGEDAEKDAPKSGFEFESIVTRARKAVDKMKLRGVDMVVCLSHSGTNEDADKSEDEILAKEVPGIDVIISGHTHTKLEKYIKYGDTYIVSAGSYGKYLGELELTQGEKGRWTLTEYSLKKMNESVAQDEGILAEIDKYKKLVNEEYLSQFNYTYDKVLANNDIEFTQMDKFGKTLKEEPLGSIIADSYIYAVKKAEGDKYKPVVASVAPAGTIRDTLQKGQITVADAFAVCSLGIGKDRIPGYPLVSFYLTGKELKLAAEIDTSVSPLMPTAQLYPSGVSWTYNPNRMFLNKTTNVRLTSNLSASESVPEESIENKKLYRVVTGLYAAQMLSAAEDETKGLLKITPKTEEGAVIKDYEKYIVHDENGAEIKEWYALSSYLESFEKNKDGIPQIPNKYAQTENRKVKVDSNNVIELIKSPNQYALALGGVIIVLLLGAALLIRFVIKRRNR